MDALGARRPVGWLIDNQGWSIRLHGSISRLHGSG